MNTAPTTPGREVTAADITRWAAAADNTPAGLAAALDNNTGTGRTGTHEGFRATMRALRTGALAPTTIGTATPTGGDLDAVTAALAADPTAVGPAEQHAISIAYHLGVCAALTTLVWCENPGHGHDPHGQTATCRHPHEVPPAAPVGTVDTTQEG